jgi:Tim10/DDP family zinc finger.
MNANALNEYVINKFFEYDEFCFDKCVKVPEKPFSQKEEDCLSKTR